ncbi:PqiC family protein [Salipiger marinus]|uniref:PqiC family protein n=1 Tax=Salipiger marinus TaxID=555512 RepID=UPI004058E84F
MFPKTLTFMVPLLLAAACATPEQRFRIEPAPVEQTRRIAVGTLEVRDVSLPTYAEASEILIEGADGALTPAENALWADDPRRAVSLALADRLGRITGATVASEPWPLEEPAQAAVHVRVSEMVARANGTFELGGQYALSSFDRVIRERVQRFAITVPLRAASPAGIAAATGTAVSQLADTIAADLAR